MNMKKYSKRITFGKVDFWGHGRRSNAAQVDLEYRLCAKHENGATRLYWEFSACGAIWNHIHTDHISGGQNLDAMNEFADIRNNATFREVYDLWNKYHCNGLTAGSPAQEAAKSEFVYDREKPTWNWYDTEDINENADTYGRHMTDREAEANAAKAAGHSVKRDTGDYNDQLAVYLARRGLYTDKSYIYNGKPYKYGHAWLVTEIPESDKARIRALVGITKEDEERAEEETRRELATAEGAA